MLIFDAHLDLAMNALSHERSLANPLSSIREREQASKGVADERGRATVSLPAMRRGGVGLCLATLLARVKPWVGPKSTKPRNHGDWPEPSMAYAIAQGQLAWYRLLEERGEIRVITDAAALHEHAKLWQQHITSEQARTNTAPDHDERNFGELTEPKAGLVPIGVILTMEGADPIVEPGQLERWHAQGLRTLMPAHFGQSRYAAGTPSTDAANSHDVDGPLTDRGRALLERMQRLGMPLDISHLSDQSVAEALDRFGGAIYASHSTSRALVAANERVHPMRMVTDEQIRRITARGGMVGVPLFNAYLKAGYTQASSSDSVSLDDVVDHIDHICQIAGSAEHVGLGSDLDGGFGAEHTPTEIDSIEHLPRLSQSLSHRGYTDEQIAQFTHRNWLNFFGQTLP